MERHHGCVTERESSEVITRKWTSESKRERSGEFKPAAYFGLGLPASWTVRKERVVYSITLWCFVMANRYAIHRLEYLGFGLDRFQTPISSDTTGFLQDAAAKETHFESHAEGLWAAESEGTSASHLCIFSFLATHRRYKKPSGSESSGGYHGDVEQSWRLGCVSLSDTWAQCNVSLACVHVDNIFIHLFSPPS